MSTAHVEEALPPNTRDALRSRFGGLFGDLFAGFTLWAVFAAQALAYSRLAHATPVAGLVTAIAGAAVYSILGSSWRNSIGPAGAIAAIVGTAVVKVPPEHLGPSLAMLTILVGVFLVGFGVARITFLPRLFPLPVFVGYLSGTGISILVGQAKDLVGHGTTALAVGLLAIAAIIVLRRTLPKAPGPLLVLVAATIASVLLKFPSRGVPVIGDALGSFGALTLPRGLGRREIESLIGPALSLALLVYVDSLANAEMLAKRSDPPLRPGREFYALGATSLVSALFGGFVPGCSSSRSIVALRSGQRTKLAGGVAALLLLLTSLSVVRFISPMPLAALAGVVFVAAFDLVDVRRLREFWGLRRADFWIAIVAGALVVFVGPVVGAGLGVLLALAETFRRGMAPHRWMVSADAPEGRLYRRFDAQGATVTDGVLIYRFGTVLFFGNSETLLDDMRELVRRGDASLRTVILNCDAMGVLDATARDALVRSQQLLHEHDIVLLLGNVRRDLREALTKIGKFTIMEEDDFVAAFTKIRRGARKEP